MQRLEPERWVDVGRLGLVLGGGGGPGRRLRGLLEALHDGSRASEQLEEGGVVLVAERVAATLGNSRIGAEIRSTRLLVRELLELTLSNELHVQARKRLTEVIQLLQTYARLAELELAAGEKPRAGDVSLPEGTKARITEWVEGEDAKVREEEALMDELSQAMKARGYDPTPIRQVMGG